MVKLEKNQFKNGGIDLPQLDDTIESGYYSVGANGYSGGLIVFNLAGASIGPVQFFKDGYSKEKPWKVRNKIDNNRWTPWSILVDDSMFKLEGTTLDIDIPTP